VLVVEDHAPFRKLICSTLRGKWEFRQIFEASDGFEAVQRAQELQPDLILLDIGLPILSGIKAAQKIRELSTKSKVLFVSLESSNDVVQEALRSGASGYVIKLNIANELLAAVDAVLRGEQFLSSGLANPSLLTGGSSSRYEDKSGADA
jgi:DNA-binding NarL/FixJ family response regulator